jgi:fructose-1-phosphate kinase PfkB-like protein
VTAPGRGRVVCTALNPALDITYISPRFVIGEANRVSRVHAQAGRGSRVAWWATK